MAYGAILGQTPTASNVTYNNSQTSSIITGTNVQQAIDQLFTSVSNGKALIAGAITDKGVSTSADATFQQMATNIGEIKATKKYKVYGSGPLLPSEAEPGEIVPICAGEVQATGFYIYNASEDGERGDGTFGSAQIASGIENLPTFVKAVFENIPSTFAPPSTQYLVSWFFMPNSDVFVAII